MNIRLTRDRMFRPFHNAAPLHVENNYYLNKDDCVASRTDGSNIDKDFGYDDGVASNQEGSHDDDVDSRTNDDPDDEDLSSDNNEYYGSK